MSKKVFLSQLMKKIEKKENEYIKNSGVLDIKYKKIVLKDWLESDLLDLYGDINRGVKQAEQISAADDASKTRKMVLVMGQNIVSQELKRRDSHGVFFFVPVADISTDCGIDIVFLQGFNLGD
jgi:hypothetical protein